MAEVGELLGPFRLLQPLTATRRLALAEALDGGARAIVKVASLSLPGSLASLRREAGALRRLGHPRVPRWLGEDLDTARPWLARGFVEGAALSAQLGGAPGEAHPRSGLLSQMIALCDALEGLHQEGIVHGDLTPDNVVVDLRGQPWLVDLGLCLLLGGANDPRTGWHRDGEGRPWGPSGTPAWASPEQIRGQAIDARADLYSLGCILFACLTGAPPFVDRNPRLVALDQLRTPAPRLSSRLPEVDPAVDELVAALLAKAPGDRPASAAEVSARLRHRTGSPRPARSGPERRPPLIRAPLVGRGELVEELVGLLGGAGEGGWASIPLVVGVSGSGKTRLAQEVARHSALRQAGILFARGDEQQDGAPLSLLRPAFTHMADLLWGAPLAPPIRGDVATLSPYAPALRRLMGGEGGEAGGSTTVGRVIRAAQALIWRYLDGGPGLLIADDLQWADGISLRILAALASPAEGRPGLPILGLSRPIHGEEAHLAALLEHPGVRRIPLERLGVGDIADLLSGLMGGDAGGGMAARIASRCAGNPLYAAEYLRAAWEGGALGARRGRGEPPGGGGEPELPTPRSLRTLQRRRLSRLDPPLRLVVQGAAVAGPEVDGATLAAALCLSPGEVDGRGAALRSLGILELRVGGGVGFTHDSLREVALTSMRLPRRQALHLAIADALGPQGAPAARAAHYERGGAVERARTLYLTAARQAGGAGALLEADRLFRAWLALDPPDPATRAKGRIDHVELALISLGEEPRALEACQLVVADAEVAGEPLLGLRARVLMGIRLRRLDRMPEARDVLGGCLAAVRAAGDDALRALCMNALCDYHNAAGEMSQALEAGREAVDAASRAGEQALEASACCNLGVAHYLKGDIPSALETLSRGLALNRRLGRCHGILAILINLGQLRGELGDLRGAIANLEEGLRLSTELADRLRTSNLHYGLGLSWYFMGDMERAQRAFEQALEIGEVLDAPRSQARAYGGLARVAWSRGEWEKARGLSARSRALFRAIGDPRAEVVRRLGDLYEQTQEPGLHIPLAQAHAEADALLEEARALELGRQVSRAQMLKARLFRITGDLTQARALCQRACAQVPWEPTPTLAACELLLEWGELLVALGEDASGPIRDVEVFLCQAGALPASPLRVALAGLRERAAARPPAAVSPASEGG